MSFSNGCDHNASVDITTFEDQAKGRRVSMSPDEFVKWVERMSPAKPLEYQKKFLRALWVKPTARGGEGAIAGSGAHAIISDDPIS